METVVDAAVETVIDTAFREQLLDRREKLQSAASGVSRNGEFAHLLKEVDIALMRLDEGSYGLCESCLAPVETDRLLADPLTDVCLGCLTPKQQRALEEDLQLAVRIQRGLLPPRQVNSGAWEIAYHFEPAGLVSGDYCDLIRTGDGDLYFILGDVSGKGVAAALLMSNLQAMFRSLVSLKLPLTELMERASRLFCESTLSTHYATLVCGRIANNGEIEICNAGHLPPVVIKQCGTLMLDSTGLPLGLFSDNQFTCRKLHLETGDTLLLYTDGLTEAADFFGVEYGIERLLQTVNVPFSPQPEELIRTCVNDHSRFRGGVEKTDDMSLMALRFAG